MKSLIIKSVLILCSAAVAVARPDYDCSGGISHDDYVLSRYGSYPRLASHQAAVNSVLRSVDADAAFDLYQSGVISAREYVDLYLYDDLLDLYRRDDLDFDLLPWTSRDRLRWELDSDSSYFRRQLTDRYRSNIFASDEVVDAVYDLINRRSDWPLRASPRETQVSRQTVVTTQSGHASKLDSVILRAERLNRINPAVSVQEYIDILLSKRGRVQEHVHLSDVEKTSRDGHTIRRVTTSSSSSRHQRVRPGVQFRVAV
ncbi:hypothetical protein EDD21DRAFT_180789 [Dissophora ornata]|nr:hypothetical protein BGZ58_006269 [Dissophora ornata]KAI8604935.1 hypothetical protein EDD21DRAFT_180789 [Dissophora ornata]